MHRQPIAAEIPTETAQLRWAGAVNVGDPVLELGSTSLADEHHEALRQSTARGQLAATPTQIGEKQTFGVVKLRASTQEQPTQRLRTGQDASDGWWRFGFAPILYESSHRALAAAIAGVP